MRREASTSPRLRALHGIALIIALASLLPGCGPGQKTKTEEEAAINVAVEHPIIRAMEEVIEVHGNLSPRALAVVVSEVSGEILELPAHEGDEVKVGQLLARIDDEEYRLSLRQSEAAYRVAKSDFESTNALFKEGMKSRLEWETKKRSYEDASSNLQMQRIRFNNCQIKSPIDGIVTERKVELHQLAGSMEQMFTIHDVTSFKLDITVTEKEVARLREGQEVRIRVDAVSQDDKEFPLIGRVSRIQPQVDPKTGTVQVEISLPNPGGGVRSGMFARLRIVTNVHENAMVIPRQAITEDEGSFVWVAEGNGVRMVQVKTGLMDEEGVEILSGLTPGDQVVVEGQGALSPKSTINVVNQPAPVNAPAPAAGEDASPPPADRGQPAPTDGGTVAPAPTTPEASPETGATAGAEGTTAQ